MDGELIRRNPKRTKAKLERLRKLAAKSSKRRFHADFDDAEYTNWTSISHENIDYEVMPIIRGVGHLTQLIDWCNENCNGLWVAKSGHLYFEKDDDAAHFAMVWK